ncbi:DUF1287 domain-containing protein [Dysgonomonas macrotermitis]|uniref:DUF1287 domain-containing protein n=1 Tax=Dysgonomonas macrotermitis TaxID=1346286 RepID=A0A1M5H5Z6_9BACT|nr:DUF1287 domain-containing protein [Dysgonomonas macrotermitis]SHG11338.1 hypothetical protein SAMN05444362_11597 [Dysgonomonas macrotermitis]
MPETTNKYRYWIVLVVFLSLFNNVKAQEADFYKQLSDAAISLTHSKVIYDPAYFKISYPKGDVPSNKGVCTDVIIRAYRKLNIDLQKEIHLDMKANFDKYPSRKKWGLNSTDTNIDHRRVPNQQVFFSRKGTVKPITNNSQDYLAGDIVSWNLGNGLTHIGIVIDKKSRDGKRPLIVHNIGQGQVIEDCLFSWKITGHYRYKK